MKTETTLLSGWLKKFTASRQALKNAYGSMRRAFDGKSSGSLSDRAVKRRRQWAHAGYTLLFALIAAYFLVMPSPLAPHIVPLKVGDLVEHDIISPLTVNIEPKTLSESRKEELTKKIAPVFDYDETALENWLQRWQQAFVTIRQEFFVKNAGSKKSPPEISDAINHRLFDLTGQVLSETDLNLLIHDSFSTTDAHLFLSVGEHLLGRLISPTDLFPYYYSTGIIVRQLNHALSETFVYDLSRVWSIEQAAEYLAHVPKILAHENRTSAAKMSELVSHLLIPNLKFNAELTQKRTSAALATVSRTTWSVRLGQTIAHRGERISEQESELLDSLSQLTSPGARIKNFWFYAILFFMIFQTLLRANITRKGFRQLPMKDALLFLLLAVIILGLAKFLVPYLRVVLSNLHAAEGAKYLIPISFGGIIVHLMMGKESALIFSLIVSLVAGTFLDYNLQYTLWALVISISSIQSVKACKQRTDLFRCGFTSGLVGAVVVLAFELLQSSGLTHVPWLPLLIVVGCAFISGLLAAVISATLIPIFESALGYTTNLKLLELSNFNHPLLHNLMMKAPGTYHHSIIVGSLAEIAADKVKANGLLARVSAYYHDIGKMNKPLYFIENQSPNNNPHDHLQPSMSAKILFSHVKNGVRLAREYNLGAKITNIIEQHHGTTLVSFFLNKAKKTVDPSVESVSEDDFRYPGPRPQTREAAIVMLADACEAATRSIAEPTAAKIQTMVHNIINRRFLDQQFIECDLTFSDLNSIEEVFTRTLVSLYHHRIEYPGQTAPDPFTSTLVDLPLPIKKSDPL